jgi:superoxide dismutase, Cu-Zn family
LAEIDREHRRTSMKTLLLATTCLVGLVVSASAQTATATFLDVAGKEIGTATLTQTANGVLIALDVRGLPPGAHAFHIHEKGSCDPATKFSSAGGHYALGKKHGYKTEGGPHAGDMPNQFVGQDGVLRAEVFNPNVTLGSGAGTLFPSGGTSLVIHAGADDYMSQPSGNSGERIACAIIQRR